MLDIPELDDMICRRLGRHDLVQCARVCKKWHTLVMPHLWRDLSDLWWRNAGSFRRIVLDDYLAERRHQELQGEESSVGMYTQARQSHPLSALAMYGHCIRLLSYPSGLESILQSPRSATEQAEGPTAKELLLHLFKRCSSNVQVEYSWLELGDLDLEPDNPGRAIAEFTLPRVRHLEIKFRHYSTSPEDMGLGRLDQCSMLEKLVLRVEGFSGTEGVKEVQIKDELKGWTSLKELTLYDWVDNPNTLWPWLFRRCGSVEKLRVKTCCDAQGIQQGMLAYMPNIRDISLGGDHKGDISDDRMATLLGGSRTGWRVVKVELPCKLGGQAMDALAKHIPTLEVLDVDQTEGASSDMFQVPRSCTKLHTLALIDTGYCDMNSCSKVDAKVFIDLDSNTESLKPWKCEASLKVLKVMIVGIPRPDLEGYDGVLKEAYPGEGREIQGKVYDRLARLTNLETLWLGDVCGSSGVESPEMSLESGLDKISGLKKLKEVNIAGFVMRVGVREVQWMVENWPELRTIYGFDDDGFDGHGYGKDGYDQGGVGEEAATWLRDNHPEITVKRTW